MERDLILALETSCDDTAAAVVAGGRFIRSSLVSSQEELHRRFGGVVPEIASRQHLEIINPLIDVALEEAGVSLEDLAAVAVSCGPGLVGALLVGVSTAKALAYALRRPLLAVNHLEGHIYANFLESSPPVFPAVCLVVSGGHTSLIWMEDHGRLRPLGATRDDAAGEVFDKVARVMGLGYPGGPLIDALAAEGDPRAVSFPRARVGRPEDFEFSFSGLKSAVINHLERERRRGSPAAPADLAASFQAAVVDALVEKTVAAVRRCGARQVFLAGGVAANRQLRQDLQEALYRYGVNMRCPPPSLCTDNAAMIGAAAFYRYRRGEQAPLTLNAYPGLPLGGEQGVPPVM